MTPIRKLHPTREPSTPPGEVVEWWFGAITDAAALYSVKARTWFEARSLAMRGHDLVWVFPFGEAP